MQKIVPHLWYDTQALEAARFYVSLFEDSAILGTVTLPDTPSGDAMTVDFQLAGLRIAAISAGPYFQFNPSISLMVACESAEEVDRLYAALSVGGADLMPLDEYPFSRRYAWIADRYGLNWQLMLSDHIEPGHRIRPSLLFAGEACGKAEEALDLYSSVFTPSVKGFVNRYAEGEAEDSRAKINYAEISLLDFPIVAMDHGYGADFTFNEAFSLMVLCDTQEEIDHYWDRLSFVPEAEQCGWIKDRFGLSWQIAPANLNETLKNSAPEVVKRVTQAFLTMKKFDLAALEKARLG